MNYIEKIFVICCCLGGLIACDEESAPLIFDETTEDYQLYDYYIDQYGNEGIVAYIYEPKSSKSKRIMVISSDESYQSWGPMGEAVYKNDTITASTWNDPAYGMAMYQSMKSWGVEKFPAQSWCDKKNMGEDTPKGSSWCLPSYWELGYIFNNYSELNKALLSIGGTPLTENHLYWSCTEYYDNYKIFSDNQYDIGYDKENKAIPKSPSKTNYSDKDRWLKKNKYYVRAIKYVYFRTY